MAVEYLVVLDHPDVVFNPVETLVVVTAPLLVLMISCGWSILLSPNEVSDVSCHLALSIFSEVEALRKVFRIYNYNIV